MFRERLTNGQIKKRKENRTRNTEKEVERIMKTNRRMNRSLGSVFVQDRIKEIEIESHIYDTELKTDRLLMSN